MERVSDTTGNIMLVVAQNEMLIRPMIHLFGGSGHRPRIWTCLFYMYQSVGFEFYNLSSSSKKENTYTKKIPTHHGRQGSFSEVDHLHKTPFIPQKLKAMVTKPDMLEWINVL